MALQYAGQIIEMATFTLRGVTVITTIVLLIVLIKKVGFPTSLEKLVTLALAVSAGILFLICWYRRGFDQTYAKFTGLVQFMIAPRQPT